jgi:hypothetical protein
VLASRLDHTKRKALQVEGSDHDEDDEDNNDDDDDEDRVEDSREVQRVAKAVKRDEHINSDDF